MELTTLYKQYRAAKMAADQAAKEEDKLKKALKKAMEEAGVKNYTDEDGFLFERIVQNRVCWRASKRKDLLSVSRQLRQ